jgi:acetylornithine/succinyldiaminopimelate/putrescine aminotransferase
VFAGDHGSTYGGNLLATRAGLYVLEQLTGTSEAEPYRAPAGLIGRVQELGSLFEHALNRLAAEHAVVSAVRGVGLMRALELTMDATPVVDGARQAGLLVNRTAERVVRMLPPLTVTAAEIEQAAGILDRVLASLSVGSEVTK